MSHYALAGDLTGALAGDLTGVASAISQFYFQCLTLSKDVGTQEVVFISQNAHPTTKGA